MPPLTTIYGDGNGTRVIGDSALIPEKLHPNVLAYVALVVADGYTPPLSRITALNNLTWNLVGSGLWDKMDAIYPFIGGTTGNQHRHNLRDPRALTAAFMITWSGTVTFSDDGNQGNNTNGLGNTNLTPSTHVASATSIHVSAYINIAQTSPGGLGRVAVGAGATGFTEIATSPSLSNNYYGLANSSTSTGVPNAGVSTAGFYLSSRVSNSDQRLYRNGVQVGNTATVSATASTSAIGIHARSTATGGGAGAPFYSNNRIAFVSIGDGLNRYEQAILYGMVQSYQTALGRQV